MAIEIPPFIDDFPIKTSIYRSPCWPWVGHFFSTQPMFCCLYICAHNLPKNCWAVYEGSLQKKIKKKQLVRKKYHQNQIPSMFHLIQFETVARVTLITQNIPKQYGFVWKYCTPKNPIVNYNVHSFSLLILNYGIQYPIFRQTHMHYFFYANFHQVC